MIFVIEAASEVEKVKILFLFFPSSSSSHFFFLISPPLFPSVAARVTFCLLLLAALPVGHSRDKFGLQNLRFWTSY